MILETTFLIDLEREAIRGKEGPALAFLESIPRTRLHITLTTAGEMASGSDSLAREAWGRLFQRFQVLHPDEDVAWRYGRLCRHLRRLGTPIGTNDLWIAATALVHGLPLVTRNVREFQRVPELDVRGY